MTILALIFTITLCAVITYAVFVLVAVVADLSEVGYSKKHAGANHNIGVTVCMCILISYVGVLIRIVGPIYRFFLG